MGGEPVGFDEETEKSCYIPRGTSSTVICMMSKEMIAGIAEAAAGWARLRIKHLDHIRDKMLESISSEREQIANLEKVAWNDYLDRQDDDHFLYEAEGIVGGLLLVGLDSEVEHITKQLLRHRYPPDKVMQCYKIEFLKKALAKDCGVNLESVQGFAAIDELRGKSNLVKHGGPIGEPALAAYERLRSEVAPYLEGLALVVLPGESGQESGI